MLRIPEIRYSSFEKLLNITDEQKEILIDELGKIKPEKLTLRSEICYEIAEKVKIKISEFEEFFDFLLELYYIFYTEEYETTIDEFLEDLQDALIDTNKESLIPRNNDWESFKSFLKKILEMDETIGIIAKARILKVDHTNVFKSSQIYTDIRPIFTRDIENSKPSAVIFHNLNIAFINKGKRDEISIALDFKDLIQVKKIIERAIKKQKALQNFLKEKEINYINDEWE